MYKIDGGTSCSARLIAGKPENRTHHEIVHYYYYYVDILFAQYRDTHTHTHTHTLCTYGINCVTVELDNVSGSFRVYWCYYLHTPAGVKIECAFYEVLLLKVVCCPCSRSDHLTTIYNEYLYVVKMFMMHLHTLKLQR